MESDSSEISVASILVLGLFVLAAVVFMLAS